MVALVVAAAGWYPMAVFRDRARRRWPLHRSFLWVTGVVAAAAAVVGPLAAWAHMDFVGHMLAHVLLGMAAPLLLVASRPVTLLLRSIDVVPARRLSRILRSGPISFFLHPVVAAVLSIGGLWLIYATPVFGQLHTNALLGVAVHVHVFVAGYLFTAAIVGRDPRPHRFGFGLKAAVLVGAIAAHDILAKFLYVAPPAGVSTAAAEAGAMVMYYAGDAVEIVLIVVLCREWYTASAPAVRKRNDQGQASSELRGGRA
ncbi:cytochrome c oxidase assembly protein [Leifsonia sp. SIMBA_070]|uniref:cytochrome c oxidase assembly protein n=1 Tax=Leifsonia sp. SIMBA_070 TaxID=3085810 RepID=UPI003979FFD5